MPARYLDFFLACRELFHGFGDEIHTAGHMASRTDLVLIVHVTWEKKFQTCCGIIPEIPHYTLKLSHKTRSLKKFRKLKIFLRWEKNRNMLVDETYFTRITRINSSITKFSRYYCSTKERCKAGLMISENRWQYPHVSIFFSSKKIFQFSKLF